MVIHKNVECRKEVENFVAQGSWRYIKPIRVNGLNMDRLYDLMLVLTSLYGSEILT